VHLVMLGKQGMRERELVRRVVEGDSNRGGMGSG
jgi:hypothetical protein